MGDSTVYLFLHVMKSAGTTFIEHLEANVPRSRCYPDAPRGPKRREQYTMIDAVRAHAGVHGGTTLAYAGHFPFVVSKLIEVDVVLTLLREPVERTISALRHFKQHDPRCADLPLDAIYEDPWINPTHLRNYQVKQFAMVETDKLESHMDVIDVDDARLRIAVEHVEQVDVLGLTGHFDEFCQEMADRFGWTIGPVRRMRVSDGAFSVSAGLERRIREENAADVAFYDHARSLWADRRRRRGV